ncbi:unnamed protein product, partial [Brassica oleracea]
EKHGRDHNNAHYNDDSDGNGELRGSNTSSRHSLLEIVIPVVLIVVPLKNSYQNYFCVHSLVFLLVLLLQHQIFLLLILKLFWQRKSIILIIFASLVVLLIIVLLSLLSEIRTKLETVWIHAQTSAPTR